MASTRSIRILQIIGIVFSIIGLLVIFPDNDVWYHDVLQIILVVGLICTALAVKWDRQLKRAELN